MVPGRVEITLAWRMSAAALQVGTWLSLVCTLVPGRVGMRWAWRMGAAASQVGT